MRLVFSSLTAILCLLHVDLSSQNGIRWHADLRVTDLRRLSDRLSIREISDDDEPLELVSNDSVGTRRRVVTCAQYLSAVSAGFIPGTTYAVLFEFPFVRDCFLLRDLQRARVPVRSHLPEWDDAVLSLLPPMLEWGEKKDEPAVQPLTWAALNPAVHATGLADDRLEAEDDSTSYSFQRVGTADFNGDGTADLALVADLRAKGGSYSRSEYMILTFCRGANHFSRLTKESRPYRLETSRCR